MSNGQTLNLRMNLTFNKIEKVKICTVINRSNMHISHIRHILYILFILQTLHILHIFHACHIMHVVHKVWLSILFSKGQVSKRSSFIPWVTDMGRLWSDLGPRKSWNAFINSLHHQHPSHQKIRQWSLTYGWRGQPCRCCRSWMDMRIDDSILYSNVMMYSS